MLYVNSTVVNQLTLINCLSGQTDYRTHVGETAKYTCEVPATRSSAGTRPRPSLVNFWLVADSPTSSRGDVNVHLHTAPGWRNGCTAQLLRDVTHDSHINVVYIQLLPSALICASTRWLAKPGTGTTEPPMTHSTYRRSRVPVPRGGVSQTTLVMNLWTPDACERDSRDWPLTYRRHKSSSMGGRMWISTY